MLKKYLCVLLISLALLLPAFAHDLFLKPDSYFPAPNSRSTIRVLNGTFQASESILSRDRIRDAGVITPEGVVQPIVESWRDEGVTTVFEIQTGPPGTYTAGISTLPRDSKKTAALYNEYLAHEGLPDRLAERRARGEMKKDVRERYSKHVRAVFQVGEARTDDYKKPLGYVVEIIPQQNPYELGVGDFLEVLCIKDGKPVPNQFILSGYEHGGKLSAPVSARAGKDGIARIKLNSSGKWYIKFLYTQPAAGAADIDYETFWATLTFELRGGRKTLKPRAAGRRSR